MTWMKTHKSSGATVIERRFKGCRLVVIPKNWTKPTGPATWTASCAHFHKRGEAKTVSSAKQSAVRASRKRK